MAAGALVGLAGVFAFVVASDARHLGACRSACAQGARGVAIGLGRRETGQTAPARASYESRDALVVRPRVRRSCSSARVRSSSRTSRGGGSSHAAVAALIGVPLTVLIDGARAWITTRSACATGAFPVALATVGLRSQRSAFARWRGRPSSARCCHGRDLAAYFIPRPAGLACFLGKDRAGRADRALVRARPRAAGRDGRRSASSRRGSRPTRRSRSTSSTTRTSTQPGTQRLRRTIRFVPRDGVVPGRRRVARRRAVQGARRRDASRGGRVEARARVAATVADLRALGWVTCAGTSRRSTTSSRLRPQDEVRAAALQYVRKVSGTQKPSKANEAAFARAVDEVAHITSHLLAELVTSAPPRDRDVEAARARARAEKRFGQAA